MLILSVFVSIWTVIAQTTGVSQPILEAMIGTNVTLKCFLSEDGKDETIIWFKQNIGQQPQSIGMIQKILHPVLFNEFIKLYGGAQFGKASYLIVKEKDQPRFTIAKVIQAALPDPVHPGDSETLECVVLAESRTEDLRVFWFRPASGGSHPGVIYTNKSWTGPCEGRCVYSLPKKDVNISDAGTYYCGIATSGQILFGNGTAIVISEPVDTVLVGLVVALGCCVALMLLLVWLNCQRRVTCDSCKMRDLQHVRDGNSDTRQGSAQAEAAEGLNYAALSFSKKEPRGRRAKRELPPDAVYSAVNL
ncbi:uncharacterized protein LOC143125816 isoform X3 [Alosa pseudoharengus]|uniref:uncharacterized protein LOC143125816 isoform X3 n=1 Tax=Alosa pseudoharengus TaxID=34774 RepID=UPI003F8966C7